LMKRSTVPLNPRDLASCEVKRRRSREGFIRLPLETVSYVHAREGGHTRYQRRSLPRRRRLLLCTGRFHGGEHGSNGDEEQRRGRGRGYIESSGF
jgi:hypothetical protein